MTARETDWSEYDACPTCLVDAGKQCKGLVPRRGEGGLGHQGQRGLSRPHKDRPKLSGPVVPAEPVERPERVVSLVSAREERSAVDDATRALVDYFREPVMRGLSSPRREDVVPDVFVLLRDLVLSCRAHSGLDSEYVAGLIADHLRGRFDPGPDER